MEKDANSNPMSKKGQRVTFIFVRKLPILMTHYLRTTHIYYGANEASEPYSFASFPINDGDWICISNLLIPSSIFILSRIIFQSVDVSYIKVTSMPT